MSDPFLDSAGFELRSLPDCVSSLLVAVGAPPRLVAHLRLVHDVAVQLVCDVSDNWPSLAFDREAVAFGAATHDVGKAFHPDELNSPGVAHERDGRRLLLDRGIRDDFARFAETHAVSKHRDDASLEDLLVALADTCWKGKRSERLDDLVVDAIIAQVASERWQIFSSLDAIIEKHAADGDKRLAWQGQY